MRPQNAARLASLLVMLVPVQLWADEAFDPPAGVASGFLGRAQARSARSARAEVLLSLAALASPGGFGALATLSVPLERVAAPGKVASYTYLTPTVPAGERATATVLVGPDAAHDAVAAAWRVAGLGACDGSLDSMASRARWSALLPEARVRVLKRMSDATHSTSSASSGTDPETGTYYGAGEALLLEGRLTWRLDRLLFADEEPSIERLRLERAEARMRVASRTVELLGRWQRALVDATSSTPGTADHTDALLRGVEAAVAIDVMTDGWFTRWRGGGTATDDGTR